MPSPKDPVKRKLWIQRLSESHKGQVPWCKGKKLGYTPKMAFKKGHISLNKGRKPTEDEQKRLREIGFKKGNVPWNKGLTKEDDPRISRIGFQKGHPPFNKGGGFAKGHCPWNKELSCEKQPFYGRHHTEKAKGKISETKRKQFEEDSNLKKQTISQLHSKENRKRALKAIMRKPNKKEQFLINLFHEYGLPFHYVGDGKLIIDGKCPDFSDGNGNLIELFGDYWHRNDDPQERIDFFKERGYDCLVIWEHELSSPSELINRVEENMEY